MNEIYDDADTAPLIIFMCDTEIPLITLITLMNSLYCLYVVVPYGEVFNGFFGFLSAQQYL